MFQVALLCTVARLGRPTEAVLGKTHIRLQPETLSMKYSQNCSELGHGHLMPLQETTSPLLIDFFPRLLPQKRGLPSGTVPQFAPCAAFVHHVEAFSKFGDEPIPSTKTIMSKCMACTSLCSAAIRIHLGDSGRFLGLLVPISKSSANLVWATA